jgi:lycopene cyclase domain-containing protein
MPEYTLLTTVGIAAVVLLELLLLRTGIFRTAQYWCAMAIVFAFQVLVDGFLTRLSAPVVIYAPQHHLGVRWPWDIPVEDFGFGFCLVTLTILVWKAAARGGVEPDG